MSHIRLIWIMICIIPALPGLIEQGEFEGNKENHD